MMACYESTFIARQDLSTQDVTKVTDGFARIISEQGGKLIKKENWGVRPLAYKIQKNRKGHYVFLGFEAPAAAVRELERNYRISEDVIRHLTVRVESIEKGPSIILQADTRSDNENFLDN